LALFAVAITGCTSVAPLSTPLVVIPVTPLPGTSLPPSFAVPSVPLASLPTASLPPTETVEPTVVPIITPSPTPEVTPTPTPKPTKKPTPTPSPTPTPTPGDAEVHIDQSTIPPAWYAGQPYTIRIYIAALGTTNLPTVRVKVVASNEGVSETFMTGAIAITDSYYHDVQLTLPAYGPTTITATATLPNGYVDTNRDNNKDSFDVTVTPAF